MIPNLRYIIFFILHLFLFQPSFAQNQITNFSTDDDLPSNVGLVNRLIDGLVNDFFRKTDRQDLNTKALEPSINNRIFDPPKPTDDRKLDVGVFLKGRGAKLIVLDKIYGTSEQFELLSNSRANYGTINFILVECFFQRDGLNMNSLASVRILDSRQHREVFDGWISSSQSHLTNYDNYRYNFWLLSCTISDHE